MNETTAMTIPTHLRNGSKVTVTKGREEGEAGRIVRTCPLMGYRWLTLNKFRRDPIYCNYEFGPFVDNELAKRGML